jgi:hypothetical protein
MGDYKVKESVGTRRPLRNHYRLPVRELTFQATSFWLECPMNQFVQSRISFPLLAAALLLITSPRAAIAQQSRQSVSAAVSSTTAAQRRITARPMTAIDMKLMAAHMEMTPRRPMTAADSIRAMAIVTELRSAIAKYRDVRVAEADGFRMFAPRVADQPIYHFTKNLWALENQFRFNPEKPTSLLYKKDSTGKFILLGAMYTAPKRYLPEDIDKRIPTSVAQWHRHINWCLPPRKNPERWTEMRNGHSVFGPLGVATREECDAAGGRFVKSIFGWMVHANVFASDNPAVIWSDSHMRGDEIMFHLDGALDR